jgi:hypothetical protein
MFIIHYSNGETITEKEKEWTDVPKENITSIQLKDENTGLVHTLSCFNTDIQPLGWFQHKVGLVRLDTMENIKDVEQEVGMIINKQGDCVILNLNKRTGYTKIYYSNIFRMGLNLKLHGIKL